MEARATVVELLEDGVAMVSVERRAACDGCHKTADGQSCSICTLLGGNRESRAKARNTVGAAVGDVVEIRTGTRRVLGYAALVFLLPVVLAIVGYLIGGWLALGDVLSLCLALACLVVSFVGIGLYSKWVVSRRLDVEIVTILRTRA